MARGKNGDMCERKGTGGKDPFGMYSNKALHAVNKDPRTHGNVCTMIEPYVDPQDRTELFLLDEGEKKVEIEPETRESLPSPTTYISAPR